ncbi:DsbA family protein [Streptomyces sp. NRRL B-3648]|uniref:DsbA family protein n=1 Tax=Streptomyces sp. NRRL B-3648 TaxID=1519493 RepID=UPI0006AE3E7D|nr:DsbA family protein [Streptomyces sp. NRRL B-3648]KOV94556.1 hypothetical protein ADL04_23355 [Streptomyces sp. NRRL B-3648]
MRRRPRLYFSLRSPYSWMAVEQLERRFPRATDLIDYYPFWEPEPRLRQALHDRGAEVLYTPMSKAKHLYMLGDVKRTAARFGHPLVWPVDQQGQEWELPHLAWLAARRRGEEQTLYRALVEARWHRGERIYDEDVFIRVADAAGLDGAALRAAEFDPAVRTEAVDVLEAAWEDDIFGFPYFRIGRERLWGLDRLDDFVTALEEVYGEHSSPAAAPAVENDPLDGVPALLADRIGAYDRDTAGGCG